MPSQQTPPPPQVPIYSSSSLKAGATFVGHQKSGRSTYEVSVNFKTVDFSTSTLCGFLQINGLTEDYPTLTTFFDAEIIGDRYSFQTRKWDADSKCDRDHWSRFAEFLPHKDFDKSDFVFDQSTSNQVWMRWKEHFLVPDHRVKNISGASFAGFYYIMYDRVTDLITGFYYHENSERFQFLKLKLVPDKCSEEFEFR